MATKKKPKKHDITKSEIAAQLGKQRIPLTPHNISMLKNFVDGQYVEAYGDPWELTATIPPRCPYCHREGYDVAETIRQNPLFWDMKIVAQRGTVLILARCIHCANTYRAVLAWIYHTPLDEDGADQIIQEEELPWLKLPPVLAS